MEIELRMMNFVDELLAISMGWGREEGEAGGVREVDLLADNLLDML